MSLQTSECVRLVLRHEPAVADHIGGKNGHQLAFHSSRPVVRERIVNLLLHRIKGASAIPCGGLRLDFWGAVSEPRDQFSNSRISSITRDCRRSWPNAPTR